MEHIVTLSSKGQFTLPVAERKKFDQRQFLLETKGNMIVLRPIEIKVLKSKDDLGDFSSLGVSSFDFWNSEDDDVYEAFYS